MVLSQDTLIYIEENEKIEASIAAKGFADIETQNRAYINTLGAELCLKYLVSENINIDNIRNIHSIKKVLEEVDIADVMLPNIHIDVRVVFDENFIFVPKSHFENNITPDIYVVFKLAQDLTQVSFLGFFEPKLINKNNANDTYYFIEKEKLNSPIDLKRFITNFQGNTNQTLPNEVLEATETIMLSMIDNEISASDKKYLLEQLTKSAELRDRFIEFENFELLSYRALTDNDIQKREIISDNIVPISGFETDEINSENTNLEQTQEIDNTTTIDTVADIDNNLEDIAINDNLDNLESTTPSDEGKTDKGNLLEDAANLGTAATLGALAAGTVAASVEGAALTEAIVDGTELLKDAADITKNTLDMTSDLIEPLNNTEKNVIAQNEIEPLQDFNLDTQDSISLDEIEIPEIEDVKEETDTNTVKFEDISNEELNFNNESSELQIENDKDVLPLENIDTSATTLDSQDNLHIDDTVSFEQLEENHFEDIPLNLDENTINVDPLPINDLTTDDIGFNLDENSTTDISVDPLPIDDIQSNPMDIALDEIDTVNQNNIDIEPLSIDDIQTDNINISEDENSTLNQSNINSENLSLEELQSDEIDIPLDINIDENDTSANTTSIEDSFPDFSDTNMNLDTLEEDNSFNNINIDQGILANETKQESEILPSIDDLYSQDDNNNLNTAEEPQIFENLSDDYNFENISEYSDQEANEKNEKNKTDSFGKNLLEGLSDNNLEDISIDNIADDIDFSDVESNSNNNQEMISSDDLLAEIDDILNSNPQEMQTEVVNENFNENFNENTNITTEETNAEDMPSTNIEALLGFGDDPEPQQDIRKTPIPQPQIQEKSVEDDIASLIDQVETNYIPNEEEQIPDISVNNDEEDNNQKLEMLFNDENNYDENHNFAEENDLTEEENTLQPPPGAALYPKSSTGSNKTLILASAVVVAVLASASVFAFLKSKNGSADIDTLAQNPTETGIMEDMPASEPVSTSANNAENKASEETKIATNTPDINAINKNEIQKAKNSKELKNTVKAPQQKPISTESYITVQKLVWDIPDYLSYSNKIKSYLVTAGKSIKLSLSADLLLATEYAYSNQVKVNIKLDNNGNVQDANIINSSGSKQIDDIVLQSVKNTLNVVKPPAGEVKGPNFNLGLIIYL